MMSYEPIGKERLNSSFRGRFIRFLGILQLGFGLLALSLNTTLVVKNFENRELLKRSLPLYSLAGFWTGLFLCITGVTALMVDTRCRVKALAILSPFTILVCIYLMVWSGLGVKENLYLGLYSILVVNGFVGVFVTFPMMCLCMNYLRVNKETPLQVSSGDTLLKDDKETAEDIEA
ncbi:DgyrCDS9334 [Dimorphilus gyrociliatus]|uniref:DgyrCDS9334 n=1 Tax=Dimorphilus gyrociliatus TaxID=2664684 RepID=A0A7I8VYW0_9ANNE|nr:DgyrCDS9334 [Dimorphilus gyrociliatus]